MPREDKMKTIDLLSLKKIQIDILKHVSIFCEQNNIKYWITCGTLLGAVRHGGYIPWDDDIDIGMLREDYEKFCLIFNSNSNRYKLLDYRLDENYFLPFGKVVDLETVLYEPDENGLKLSVNIDIFVYDYAPKNDKRIKILYRKCNHLRDYNLLRNYSFFSHKLSLKKVLLYFAKAFISLFPKKYFASKMNKIASKSAKNAGGYLCNFLSYSKVKITYESIEHLRKIKFEDDLYFAPDNYDEWLRAFYGEDYMLPPPTDKQISHHEFVAYYINKNE